jgi:hypothetical protein
MHAGIHIGIDFRFKALVVLLLKSVVRIQPIFAAFRLQYLGG